MALGKKVKKATVDGEDVYIRTLNGGKASARVIELMHKIGTEPQNILELGALMVCLCLCDENGKRVYSDDQIEEIREEASIGYLKEFTEKALEVSGLGDDAEEVRKNSEAVQ
jgi:hypothetical protein